MAISSIGVGSGLPMDELLTKLQNNENLALVPIENRKQAEQARFSAYSTLKSSLASLRSAAKALSEADDTFGALKTRLKGDGLSADVDASAIPGQYTIEISALASAQTLVAAGRDSRSEAIGSGGVITFTVAGQSRTLDMAGKDTSLDGLAEAINADPGLGVRATVLNDGSGQPYRLLLTAADTGTGGAVTGIDVAGNGALQELIGLDALDEQAATDAALTINGVPVTSSSNEIEDVIQGVTLTLDKAGEGPVTLQISRDPEVASKAIQGFVSAYNTLQTTIRNLTSFDIEAMTSQPLTGDATARAAQTSMRTALDAFLGEGGVRSLAQLGISTNPANGQLELDEAALERALAEHPEDVARLFSGEDGVAARVETAYLRLAGDGGMIGAAQDAIDDAIDALDDQHDAMQARIDATMERYRQQFISLDSMVAQMNSLSSYLTTQLSMLANVGSQASKQ